jgi:hypothetical protein
VDEVHQRIGGLRPHVPPGSASVARPVPRLMSRLASRLMSRPAEVRNRLHWRYITPHRTFVEGSCSGLCTVRVEKPTHVAGAAAPAGGSLPLWYQTQQPSTRRPSCAQSPVASHPRTQSRLPPPPAPRIPVAPAATRPQIPVAPATPRPPDPGRACCHSPPNPGRICCHSPPDPGRAYRPALLGNHASQSWQPPPPVSPVGP